MTVHLVLSNVLVKMFWQVSCSYAFENLCARLRPTNKGNREQKPITKKLAEFHNQFVLLTMAWSNIFSQTIGWFVTIEECKSWTVTDGGKSMKCVRSSHGCIGSYVLISLSICMLIIAFSGYSNNLAKIWIIHTYTTSSLSEAMMENENDFGGNPAEWGLGSFVLIPCTSTAKIDLRREKVSCAVRK